MRAQKENPRGSRRGRLLVLLVWAVAVAWSVYLVAADLNDDGGVFAVIVQAMGSIGILYALFLVTRPRMAGVLGALGVFRGDVVPESPDESREPSSAAARWAIVTITLALAIGPELRRVAYVPPKGPPRRGVLAIARALEHIHLGWAIVGWVLAMPVVSHFAQLVVDVFGPAPRAMAGLPYDAAACSVDHRETHQAAT